MRRIIINHQLIRSDVLNGDEAMENVHMFTADQWFTHN